VFTSKRACQNNFSIDQKDRSACPIPRTRTRPLLQSILSIGSAWYGELAVLAIYLAYSNSFQNGFHFDDFHTVVDNPGIRSLHDVPRFFTGATTFSVLPANRTYRQIVSASLAFDYALGRAAFTWLVKNYFSLHPLPIFMMAALAYLTALVIFQFLVPHLGGVFWVRAWC
jgi:hypothetical protein